MPSGCKAFKALLQTELPPQKSLVTEECSEPSLSKRAPSLFPTALQTPCTVSKPGHSLPCEVRLSYTHRLFITCALTRFISLSLSLSVYPCACKLWGNRARGGSSDERQWWRCSSKTHGRHHLPADEGKTKRAHHTGILSFKFSLSQSRPIGRSRCRFPYERMNEWMSKESITAFLFIIL